MCINKLRYVIKDLKSIIHPYGGRESIFTKNVKQLLPLTNFELIGEELCINHTLGIGKCDLWLANCPNNFLLSLELKVGHVDRINKQKLLEKQVYKYTDLMKVYYPEHNVYGLGAYKYEEFYKSGFKFIHYNQSTNNEIEILKNMISGSDPDPFQTAVIQTDIIQLC